MVAGSEQQNILKVYDAIAPHYAEYSGKYLPYLNAVDAMVINHLLPGMRLLDIGAGDGRRLKKIAGHHGLTDVVAIEPSTEMAALCRSATGFTVHNVCGDALGDLGEAPFSAITALWNVFGHMPDSAVRLKTLQGMAASLRPDGIIMLDVNNRHNQLAYGRLKVLKRRLIDALAFDEIRGDAYFEWKVAGRTFPTSGHLFTPREIENLFAKANLKIMERYAVHYTTGGISFSPYNGQLFYVLTHA